MALVAAVEFNHQGNHQVQRACICELPAINGAKFGLFDQRDDGLFCLAVVTAHQHIALGAVRQLRLVERLPKRRLVRRNPTRRAGGEPTVGSTVTLTLRRAVGSANTILVVGASKTQGFGSTLPLDLGPLGATGCSLHVSGDVMVSAPANGQGSVDVRAALPNDRNLIGLSVFTQWAVQDPQANSLGWAFSNALTVLIGGTP